MIPIASIRTFVVPVAFYEPGTANQALEQTRDNVLRYGEVVGCELLNFFVRQWMEQMDNHERRRLKKLGKERLEQQSRELRERLSESNPAPVGSDAWAQNYKQATLKESELRQQKPNIIYSVELDRDFVITPISPCLQGVPTYYLQCLSCRDALHSCPTRDVRCSCGGLSLAIQDEHLLLSAQSDVQWIKLIGRGTAHLGFIDNDGSRRQSAKPWWCFWK